VAAAVELTKAQGRRRKLHKINMGEIVGEISPVTHPAQRPALAALIKREGPPSVEEFFKVAFRDALDAIDLTEDVSRAIGEVWKLMDALQASTHSILHDREEYPDAREAIRQSLQEFANEMASRVADAINVIKERPEINKQGDEGIMAEPTVEEQLAEMRKSNERLGKVAQLTDAEKAFFAKQNTEAQDAFLALDNDGRVAEMEKAADEDPVIYKSKVSGAEYRASDDPRTVDMAKREDKREATLAKVQADAEATRLDAMAKSDDYKFIPGTTETKVAMLKAIESIPDEDARKSAHDALKAQNADMAKAFETVGHQLGKSAVDGGASDSLTKGAEAIMAKSENMTKEQAMAAFLDTPEGKKAYAEQA